MRTAMRLHGLTTANRSLTHRRTWPPTISAIDDAAAVLGHDVTAHGDEAGLGIDPYLRNPAPLNRCSYTRALSKDRQFKEIEQMEARSAMAVAVPDARSQSDSSFLGL